MSSAERVLRRWPPICWDNTVDSAAAEDEGDGNDALEADSDDEDRLDEAEDAYGYFVLFLSCPTVAMFLTRRMDRAAPQSMKAKVAPFHNFILERGGALKLCQERVKRTNVRHVETITLSLVQTISSVCHNKAQTTWRNLRRHIYLTLPWIRFSQWGFYFTVSLLFSDSAVSSFSLQVGSWSTSSNITCWHLRMQCLFNRCRCCRLI